VESTTVSGQYAQFCRIECHRAVKHTTARVAHIVDVAEATCVRYFFSMRCRFLASKVHGFDDDMVEAREDGVGEKGVWPELSLIVTPESVAFGLNRGELDGRAIP
jgi:hypothetical protein